MSKNLFALLIGDHVVNGHGDSIAVEQGERQWTYRDLDVGSARMASVLKAYGVTKGDRVAVQTGKSVSCLSLYLAVVRIGAVYLPINPDFTAAESSGIVADAEATIFVGTSRSVKAIGTSGDAPITRIVLESDGSGELDALATTASVLLATVSETQPGTVAAILYTSGTTGKPKGAMLTHDNLAFVAETLARQWEITEADVLLHALPMFHAHGLLIAVNSLLCAGARIVLQAKFDADAVVEHLPEATMFMGVPTFYTKLLAHPEFTRESCTSIRLFTSGSAPLSSETFDRFFSRTGQKLLERYGLTETTIITSNPLRGERIQGTVGYPLPQVLVRVTDNAGLPLGPSEIGQLEVKGPNVFLGYWRMPEKTAAEFQSDGYFKTGDLAQISSDGRVELVGRNKDLIISGGYNVYPREVEEVLLHITGVAEAAVIGVPHPDFGEGVIAIVVAKDGATLTDTEILAIAADKLAKYKLPKKIFFVDDLKKNAMGKVQKNEIKSAYDKTFH